VRDGLLLTMICSRHGAHALAGPYAVADAADGTIQSVPGVPATSDDERRAAVEEFARNCGVDLPHARQVARIAGSLWEQLAAPLKLNADDRELIESAALIANVGYLINFEGHHKHSYHLILNSELPGFERRQLQLLANVARYHRGSPPKRKHEDFRKMPPADQRRVSSLAAILRLALALDRTHQQHVESVRARVRNDSVDIIVEANGDAEVDVWAAERKVELFEKVFGRKVNFSARNGDSRASGRRGRSAKGSARRQPANGPAAITGR
jgi:exopolyphosphatase/guanosine-5'-triphosphate,3'-diphosphate pyrophosphatase